MEEQASWGGRRAGAGRPRQAVVRKSRTCTLFDDEWEITRAFMRIMKSGEKEKEACIRFVEENKESLAK